MQLTDELFWLMRLKNGRRSKMSGELCDYWDCHWCKCSIFLKRADMVWFAFLWFRCVVSSLPASANFRNMFALLHINRWERTLWSLHISHMFYAFNNVCFMFWLPAMFLGLSRFLWSLTYARFKLYLVNRFGLKGLLKWQHVNAYFCLSLAKCHFFNTYGLLSLIQNISFTEGCGNISERYLHL